MGRAMADDEKKTKVKVAMMSFNMPPAWHTEFKMDAVKRGVTMKELLEHIYAEWKRAGKP